MSEDQLQLIQLAAAIVTAVATVVLGFVTWVLARETKVLSRATAQAHVTATLEPNQWSINFLDIVVENSGNAPAYEIKVEFDPELPNFEGEKRESKAPLSSISLLRPGQAMQSNLCPVAPIVDKTYRVTISWSHRPRAKRRETLSYDLSMQDFEGLGHLGARTPFTQIAEQLKKLREDWQNVARGNNRIKTDTFSGADRAEERAEREEHYREMRERRAKEAKQTDKNDGDEASE